MPVWVASRHANPSNKPVEVTVERYEWPSCLTRADHVNDPPVRPCAVSRCRDGGPAADGVHPALRHPRGAHAPAPLQLQVPLGGGGGGGGLGRPQPEPHGPGHRGEETAGRRDRRQRGLLAPAAEEVPFLVLLPWCIAVTSPTQARMHEHGARTQTHTHTHTHTWHTHMAYTHGSCTAHTNTAHTFQFRTIKSKLSKRLSHTQKNL